MKLLILFSALVTVVIVLLQVAGGPARAWLWRTLMPMLGVFLVVLLCVFLTGYISYQNGGQVFRIL